MDKFFYLFSNPTSHANIHNRKLHKVEEYLTEKDIKFHSYICETASDARSYIDSIIANGGGDIIVIGGDGTLFNAINSISDFEKIRIGFIVGGTGNDFVRTLGINHDVRAALDDILKCEETRIDLMQIGDYYGLNVMATGLDIEVLKRCNRMKLFRGKAQYYISLLITLIKFSSYHIRFTIDGVRYERDALLIAVGNARYFGGGMKICPEAMIDDGLLNITVVNQIPKLKLPRNLPLFIKGKHTNCKYIESFVGKEVSVEITTHNDEPKLINIDGEILDAPYICKVLPAALRILNPNIGK